MQRAMFNDQLTEILGYRLNTFSGEDKVIANDRFRNQVRYCTRDNRYIIQKQSNEYLIFSEDEYLEHYQQQLKAEKDYMKTRKIQ